MIETLYNCKYTIWHYERTETIICILLKFVFNQVVPVQLIDKKIPLMHVDLMLLRFVVIQIFPFCALSTVTVIPSTQNTWNVYDELGRVITKRGI